MKKILLAVFSVLIFSCDNNSGSTKDGPDPDKGSDETISPQSGESEDDNDTYNVDTGFNSEDTQK